MTLFDSTAILIVVAAALGYLNYRVFRLPHTVGLVVMGAVASLAVVAVGLAFPDAELGASMKGFLRGLDFQHQLMNGMLSFLIFAGALHVDFDALMQRRWMTLSLATVGVVVSAALIGVGFKALATLLGVEVPFRWCLVFGALISPTDPIAVMSVLKSARVPPALEASIAGESLFNDGIGIVVFSIALAAALGGEAFSFDHAAELFIAEAGGGAALGLVAGWIAYCAIKAIDEYNLELLITLALVMGGYALSEPLGVSGPVAMAVAGLFIGNRGTRFAMSDLSRGRVTQF
jgi:CPA1 family monovalent cation:H+ antiporter